MSQEPEVSPVKTLTLKLVYPVIAVLSLLVVANSLSRPTMVRPEQRRQDFMGRIEQTATPWLDRADKTFNAVGGVFDAGATFVEGLAESFNRQPNGE